MLQKTNFKKIIKKSGGVDIKFSLNNLEPDETTDQLQILSRE